MPRFFVPCENIKMNPDGSGSAIINGADAHHIARSLRMKAGDSIVLCDGKGNDYRCKINSLSDSIFIDVESYFPNITEPKYQANIFQAIVKGDKFDTVIQKSVECGAYSITPFISSRCTVKLPEGDQERKIRRWQKIAEEAAKQCGRGIIPKIYPPLHFKKMLSAAISCELPLFCYEFGTLPLRNALSVTAPTSISVIIGPEGGFSNDEVHSAHMAGFSDISLGKRILRTETVSTFVLSCLSLTFEA